VKILLSAFACGPTHGSEPGTGWNWALQAVRFHDVWVLTRENNRHGIEEELSRKPVPSLHVEYVDIPWIRQPRMSGKLLGWAYYYLWQVAALRRARELHARVNFDLAHHITYVSWRVPSFLWKLNVPFVWGPIGGADMWPGTLLHSARWSVRQYESLRALGQRLAQSDPNVHATARAATIAIGVNKAASDLLRHLGCKNVRTLSAANIWSQEKLSLAESPRNTTLFTSAGIFVALKGFNLAIRAMIKAVENGLENVRMRIYGDGPERKILLRLIDKAGLRHIIQMPGWVDRKQLLQLQKDTDVFLFPSMRDSGGMALLEAMAAGKPVICLDCGGPGEFVTDECGIKIKPQSASQVVRDMAEAIEKLANDHRLRLRMGQAAFSRANAVYNWDVKGELMSEIYKEAVRAHGKQNR